VGAVQVDRLQQGITGDRQRRPLARQLVLAVDVDRRQAGGAQLSAREVYHCLAITPLGDPGRPGGSPQPP
jgi:hypothetical protein